MMDMGSGTTTMAMPASTETSSMDMDMDMGMGMASMRMVFFTATDTPLWSDSFTPKNAGQYAGICIFLIALAAIFRMIVALRVNLFRALAAMERRQQGGPLLSAYNVEATKGSSCCGSTGDQSAQRPWRAADIVMTAFLDLVIAGVSYLLMLAVMTMNVGYFLSILAGVFVGSVVCGHWTNGIIAH